MRYLIVFIFFLFTIVGCNTTNNDNLPSDTPKVNSAPNSDIQQPKVSLPTPPTTQETTAEWGQKASNGVVAIKLEGILDAGLSSGDTGVYLSVWNDSENKCSLKQADIKVTIHPLDNTQQDKTIPITLKTDKPPVLTKEVPEVIDLSLLGLSGQLFTRPGDEYDITLMLTSEASPQTFHVVRSNGAMDVVKRPEGNNKTIWK